MFKFITVRLCSLYDDLDTDCADSSEQEVRKNTAA